MSNKEEYKKYLLMCLDANNSANDNGSGGESSGSDGDAAAFDDPAPDIRESFRQVLDEIAGNAHLQYGCRTISGIAALLDALGRWGARNKTVEIGLREVDKECATPFRHASPPDIDGVAESNRLSGLLPSEMALLGDRALEMNFYKKYAEHRLQTFDSRSHIRITEQFERPAITAEKKGPYIVCLDTSGSMRGKPEEVAKAICYGLLLRSREEGRKCYVISYSADIEILDLTDWNTGMNEIVDFLTYSFYGGTDLEPALAEVWRILAKEDYRLADVLVISDFEVDDLQPQTILQIRDLQAHNVQFHSLLIGDCCNSDVVNRFDRNWRYDYKKRSVVVAT